jgi:hypothetical protein
MDNWYSDDTGELFKEPLGELKSLEKGALYTDASSPLDSDLESSELQGEMYP